jgi:hypothetical protein
MRTNTVIADLFFPGTSKNNDDAEKEEVDESLQIIEELTKKVDSKDVLWLDANVLTFAVLSAFKPNRRKLQLTQQR